MILNSVYKIRAAGQPTCRTLVLTLWVACIMAQTQVHAQQAATVADSLLQQATRATTDTARLAAYLNLIGYAATNQAAKVKNYITQAMPVATRLKDSVAIASLLRLQGGAYRTLGNMDSALHYYYASIAILERQNQPQQLAAAYNDVARFNRRNNPDRAIGFYNKAMNLYQQLNDSSGMATIYNESGVAFENKGDYAEAERRYTAGLQLNQALGDSVGISYSLGFLSGLYAGQHQYTRAEPLALQVLQMREQLKDSFALAIAATNVGELYAQMGVSAKAATYLLRSNRIASAIGFTDIMAHNYGLLAGLAEAQGNYKEALAYTKEQTTLQDSIMQVAKMKQIEELSTRYETAEKELKIQEQGFALKRKNLLIALVAALAVLTGLTALYLYKRRQYKHRQELERQQRLQQEQATRAVMEAEENERRRIAAELHDGVGQLMSAARMNLGALEPELKTLAPDLQNRFDKIIGLVDESCREVRAVSHSMMPNALLKRGLAAAIRDFVEKIDNRVIKVQLHAEGLDRRLEPAVESMLYRVIQECVNNVIKHSGANQLDLSLTADDEGISVTVEDNGKGFNPEQIAKEGLGLQNIKSRIKYLKGTVDIDSAPGRGTLIALHVPWQTA